MLTPEEIQSREFLVSLRGYDRDEVHAFLGRVAEQLAQTEAKAAQLQQRLDRLKSQQGSGASDAPAIAQQVASSPEPSAMFAEIGKETQRILEAAQEAGQQIQRKARQDADRDLQAARSQAAKLIAEGERRREHVERIVAEMEQARAAMSVQLRGVGRTIEQTLKELAPDGAGNSTVREAIGAEMGGGPTSASATDEDASAPATQPAADKPEPPAQPPAPEPPPAAPEKPGEAPTAAEKPEPEPEREPEPPAATPAESPAAADGDAEPAKAEEADTAAPADAAEDEPKAPAKVEAEVAESAETDADTDGDADADADEEQVAPAPAAAEENHPAAGTPAPAIAEDTKDRDESAAVAAPAPVATEPAMPPEPEPAAASSSRNDPQGLRASALSPLHPKLVRKVKRELQEIQNIALDKVRRTKGQGEVDDFLPVTDDTVGLGESADDLLRQAWQAGVTAASALADRSVGEPDETPDLASMFREDAAERVRSGLAATLKMGLSAEESAQALSDRIGSVFSEFKGAQSEELAATHLIRAYEQGLLGAWTAGGIKARRWVMGREPRCPEARCRHNDQGGDVAVSQAFPSGHDVPPIHVGCTCTTVPAEESSA